MWPRTPGQMLPAPLLTLPRVYGASIVVTDEGHVIIYGGFSESSSIGDTWLLSSYCTAGLGGGNCLYASPTHLPTDAAEFTMIYDLGPDAGPLSLAVLNDRCVLTEGIAEVPLVWGGCMSDDASDWMYPKAVLISQDGLHFYDITRYVCDTDEDVDANIGGIRVYGYLAVCCDMPRVKGFYFQMGRPNEGIEGTGQTATYTGTIAFTTTDDIARQDLKGSIDHWVEDSGATGHFEDATDVRLTLGPEQACPDVEEGMLLQFPDGNRTIINISANGDQDGQVELSDAHANGTVTAVCGLDVLANAFNLKGLIDQWYQDSDSKGHFEGTERDFNNAAVVQKGSGRVGFPATGHGLVSGDYFRIYGTAHYNGSYTALPATTTTEIVVETSYTAETFTDSAKFRRRLTLGPGQACSAVKAGFLAAFADGNRTIVSITSDGEQDEEVELSDMHETAEVTAIYDLDAPNNGVSVNHISGLPTVIFTKTPTQSANYPKQSIRQILSATEITGSGEDLVVLTIKSGDNNQIGYCELAHCSIVERDGITANGTTTPTTVTFNGGQASVSLSPGQEIQSDEIPFAVDETKDYLVNFDLTFKRVVLSWQRRMFHITGLPSGPRDVSSLAVSPGAGFYQKRWDQTEANACFDKQTVSGFALVNNHCIGVTKVEAKGLHPVADALFVSHTTDESRFDISIAEDFTGVTVIQTTPGAAAVYHAVSFDARNTFKVWSPVWEQWWEIVRYSEGNWQYRDAGNGMAERWRQHASYRRSGRQ